jgi:hypothetical protein
MRTISCGDGGQWVLPIDFAGGVRVSSDRWGETMSLTETKNKSASIAIDFLRLGKEQSIKAFDGKKVRVTIDLADGKQVDEAIHQSPRIILSRENLDILMNEGMVSIPHPTDSDRDDIVIELEEE